MWSHQLPIFPTPENFDLRAEGSPKICGSCGQLTPTPATARLRWPCRCSWAHIVLRWHNAGRSAGLCFVVIPVGIRTYCSRLLESTAKLWSHRDYYLLAQLKMILELFSLFCLMISTRNLRQLSKAISVLCILHLHGICLCSSIFSWVSTK